MWSLLLSLLIFNFIISFIIAKVEINTEGKDGWAANLPTYKIRNKLTRLLFGQRPLTGYHIWFAVMVLVFLHFPYFIGLKPSIKLELSIIGVYLWGLVTEDFLWFLINPDYGIRKFNKNNISWHTWFIFLPRFYYIYFILGAALIFISTYF